MWLHKVVKTESFLQFDGCQKWFGVKGTFADEKLVMSEGIDNAISLSTLFSELNAGSASYPVPLIFVTDEYSLVGALRSSNFVVEKIL